MKQLYFIKLTLFIALLFCSTISTKASHVLGGDINWKGLSNNKYELTLKINRDCKGISINDSQYITISCTRGNVSIEKAILLKSIGWKDITNNCDTITNPPCGSGNKGFSGNGIEEHLFRGEIDFTIDTLKTMRDNGCCRFKLTYVECCRSGSITTGSANQYFELDAELDICNIDNSIKKGEDNSPFFSFPSVWNICCNQPFVYNIGSKEMDGDSLSFSLVAAKVSGGSSVNYNSPFNPTTWPMTGYCNSSSPCNCREKKWLSEGFCFDKNTGSITFHPIDCGERGVIALKIDQWRLDSSKVHWLYVGYNIREIQINVINCLENHPPVLTFETDSLTCSGDSLCVNIFSEDLMHTGQNGIQGWIDTITLAWDSSFYNANFQVFPHYLDTINSEVYAKRDARLCWLKDDRLTGYHLTISAKDKACPLTAVTSKGHKVNPFLQSKADPIVSIEKCGKVRLYVTNLDTSVYQGTYEHLWSIANINQPNAIIFSSEKADTLFDFRDTGEFIVTYSLNNPPFNCPMFFKDTFEYLPSDVNTHVSVASFEVLSDLTQCLKPNNFIFSDSSKAGAGTMSWLWIMGNGDTLSTQNPNYSYPLPGNYTVELKVNTTFGCRDSIKKVINVLSQPTSRIYTTDTIPQCFKGNSFSFYDSSTIKQDSINFIKWIFSDGSSSLSKNITKSFSSFGVYDISLVSRGAIGCYDTSYFQVTVDETPTVNFTVENALCENERFHFTNNSTINNDTIIKTLWLFGDGDSSINFNESRIYLGHGEKEVSLIVESNKGCIDTTMKKVLIHPQPIVLIGINDSIQCYTGHQFIFDENSIIANGIVVSRIWKFGDGTSYNSLSGSKTFNNPGEYELKLINFSDKGCADSASITLNVINNAISLFEVNDSIQCQFTNNFQFINKSTVPGSSIQRWTFGDGTSDSILNPSKSYSDTGVYEVKLVHNSGAFCSDSFSLFVEVNSVPEVSIGLNDSIQCNNGHQFSYIDNSTIESGNIATRIWKFGDNTSSNAQSGNKTYNTFGDYNLVLVCISNKGCEDSASIKLQVIQNPQSMFSISDSIQCLRGNNFQFTNQSTVPTNSTQVWTFGDGTSSSIDNPSKSYSDTGIYQVKLVHNTEALCSDSFSMKIKVNPNPRINSIMGDTSLRQGDTAMYIASSNAQSRVWMINQGQILSGTNDSAVTVQWTDTGYNSLTHIVGNSFGCEDTASFFVYVADTNSLSVMELTNSKIKLYPNPVKDFLTIDSDGKISNVKIFDAKGALIKVEHNKSEIDVRELITGVYFVQVTLESGEVYINKIEKY